jgi:hypothetical protein
LAIGLTFVTFKLLVKFSLTSSLEFDSVDELSLDQLLVWWAKGFFVKIFFWVENLMEFQALTGIN